jgi:hypothetical protein
MMPKSAGFYGKKTAMKYRPSQMITRDHHQIVASTRKSKKNAQTS